MYTIREAKFIEHKYVENFYSSVNECVELHSSEKIVIALKGTDIIGSARLVKEHDVLVLRTVNIAPEYQRQGIGSEILESIMPLIGKEECYCLPYSHLVSFYSRFGFQSANPDALPPFLRKRLVEYKKSFPVIAMHRKIAESIRS